MRLTDQSACVAEVVRLVRFGLHILRTYRYRGAHYHVVRWHTFTKRDVGALLAWYRRNGRCLPWRKSDVSPFARLVAEMLLRQTSARHVEKVWPVVISRYPDAQSLALAKPTELEQLIRPLGLSRQRTVALLAAARYLVEQHGGQVPTSAEQLAAIPHVGPYTSNAVLCFSFGIPAPLVDANILRIFRRYFGISTRTRNPHRERHIWLQATKVLPESDVIDFHYAILDCAALICRPRNPVCYQCPLSGCFFRRNYGNT